MRLYLNAKSAKNSHLSRSRRERTAKRVPGLILPMFSRLGGSRIAGISDVPELFGSAGMGGGKEELGIRNLVQFRCRMYVIKHLKLFFWDRCSAVTNDCKKGCTFHGNGSNRDPELIAINFRLTTYNLQLTTSLVRGLSPNFQIPDS